MFKSSVQHKIATSDSFNLHSSKRVNPSTWKWQWGKLNFAIEAEEQLVGLGVLKVILYVVYKLYCISLDLLYCTAIRGLERDNPALCRGKKKNLYRDGVHHKTVWSVMKWQRPSSCTIKTVIENHSDSKVTSRDGSLVLLCGLIISSLRTLSWSVMVQIWG